MATLNERNAHPRDEHVSFEASTHTYTIKGSSAGVTSVTTLLDTCFEQFDPDSVLNQYYTRWQQNPLKNPKYYDKTKDQIKAQWKQEGEEAARKGTELHDAIEAHYKGDTRKQGPRTPEWQHFLAFQREHQLQACRTEMTVWSEEHKLGGRVDLVVRGEDGTCALYDWKRAKDQVRKGERHWGRYGKGPLQGQGVKDNKYYRYSMQLNLYRELLERYYGYAVTRMYVVRLHPNAKTFEVTEVERMEEETTAVLAHRKESVVESQLRELCIENKERNE